MALIRCPGCGQNVSDSAKKCVHCGYNLNREYKEEQRHLCIECGNELKEGQLFCPKCGCPAGGRKETPGEEYDAYNYGNSNQEVKKTRSLIPAIVVLAAVAVLAFTMYTAYRESVYLEAADGIFETHNSTVDTFNESKTLLLSVWSNAITGEYDEKTDKFVYADGYLSDDFNDALKRLYEDEEFLEKLKALNDANIRVKILKKDLKNPPSEYEEYNELLLQYVNNDIKLNSIIINPNGSLKHISEKLNNLLEEQADLSIEMDTYI